MRLKSIFLIIAVSLSFCLTEVHATAPKDDGVKTMMHYRGVGQQFAVSYDTKYLYTMSDSEILVWDLNNRLLLKSIPFHGQSIYAHIADPRLIYVKLRDPDFGGNKGIASFAILDWTKGKVIGYRATWPATIKMSADFDIIPQDDMLVLVTNSVPTKAIGYLGGIINDIGSARTNHNDSLLVTSGVYPQVWDLRHAEVLGNIPYYRYLNGGKKTKAVDLYKLKTNSGKRPYDMPFCNSYFLPGSNDVILGGANDNVTIWTTNKSESYKAPQEISMSGGGPSPSLSILGETIVAATNNGVYRSVAGKPFTDLAAFREASGRKAFNVVSRPFGNRRFLAGSSNENGKASLMEGSFDSDKPLRFADKNYSWIQDIKISPREDYAAVTFGNTGLARVDLRGNSLMYGPNLTADYNKNEMVTSCEILPDETIVAGTSKGALNFWRKGETKSFKKSLEHHGYINTITLSSDSTRMFTTDRTGQITIWDTATLEPVVYIYQLLGLNEAGYIFLTPDNYYKATPNAREFVNFVKDGEAYAFEQFDLRNNRPDIILSRLGGDPKEIELLNKAWKKRLRRAGVSEESLSNDYHVPSAEIINREFIPAVSKNGEISLELAFEDTRFNLSNIAITINGVPVLDPSRRSLGGKRNNYRLTEKLQLASGNNDIRVWCVNEKGTSSIHQILNVTYVTEIAAKPDLYIVTAGVSNYADTRYNLGYAAKDARNLADAIKAKTSNKFREVKTLILTDNEFSIKSLDRIKKFISGARRDDVVMMQFAGHGVLDSNLDYYLAAYNMDFNNPSNGGIPYDDFVGVLDGIASVNRVCFIDACHSGELDKEDFLAVNTVEMPAGEELVFRSAGNNVKTKEDVEQVNTILSDMFLDTRWGIGATVLSSAGGEELAVESPKWKNGLFTYCLIKGLEGDVADTDKDGKLTLKEWIDYTKSNVSRLSEGRQTPTLRSRNYQNILEIK